MVDAIHMVHNHDMGEDVQKLYRESYKLTPEEMKTAEVLIGIGMDNKALKDHLKRITGKEMPRDYLRNIRQRLRKEGKPYMVPVKTSKMVDNDR